MNEFLRKIGNFYNIKRKFYTPPLLSFKLILPIIFYNLPCSSMKTYIPENMIYWSKSSYTHPPQFSVIPGNETDLVSTTFYIVPETSCQKTYKCIIPDRTIPCQALSNKTSTLSFPFINLEL